MSRRTTSLSTLSAMIDSDSEAYNSDPDAMLTLDSAVGVVADGSKSRRQPKGIVGKSSKAKGSSRRVSGASVLGVRKNAPMKKTLGNKAHRRQALAEQADGRYGSDTEEVEEFVDQDESAMVDDLDTQPVRAKQASKRSKPPAARTTKATNPRAKGQAPKSVPSRAEYTVDKEELSLEATRRVGRATTASRIKTSSRGKRQTSAEPRNVRAKYADERVVLETQMDVDTSAITLEDDDEVGPTPRPTVQHTSRARSVSKTRELPSCQPSIGRKRAGSGSDVERGGRADPLLRRKLGDITKKFENLDLKYRNLREVGIKEAEYNLEKLKKSTSERIKAAESLIASLQSELVAQTNLAKESRSLREQLDTSDTEFAKLQSQVSQLRSLLSKAQNENSALSAKLAASRNAASSVQSSEARVAGSAVKPNGGVRTVMVGSAEAAQAAVVAKLKEDLYADLSGLIIRTVKREEDTDVYDCLQTGRNGTLHFKLAVPNGNDRNTDYEEAAFSYMPQLEANRDRALMDILPDYLEEELTFPRESASRFYARVVGVLSKKCEEE
ncbi:MAG: hypothetical protein M1840_002875 [Geoglossum simile]|nr:MAG: hypothetical protein M1840_002875 [Geoglossum simile]